MLALTIKECQSIIISGNIEIYVTEIMDRSARLGIQAPKDVSIHRKKIFHKILEEQIGKKYRIGGAIHEVITWSDGVFTLKHSITGVTMQLTFDELIVRY